MKLDIACGQRKQEGFMGIDICDIPGVDIVWDLETFPWPIWNNEVTDFVCSHYVEHTKDLMRSISVIIPHMPSVPGADEALQACVRSLRGNTELIIVVNEGWGYAKAVNQGLKIATGDYFCVVNNDTYIVAGTLQNMAKYHAVTVPQIFPTPRDEMPRSFFCLPRWVYEKVGEFDERFEGGYFEDDDYIQRLRNSGIPITTAMDVGVYHRNGGGMTMKHIGEQEHFNKNRIVYEKKWSQFPRPAMQEIGKSVDKWEDEGGR